MVLHLDNSLKKKGPSAAPAPPRSKRLEHRSARELSVSIDEWMENVAIHPNHKDLLGSTIVELDMSMQGSTATMAQSNIVSPFVRIQRNCVVLTLSGRALPPHDHILSPENPPDLKDSHR
ncbi:hypothetical protein BLNAU_2954 [Blattamonas nauphoetae]|uniref:Uncharacterized protein n=1 Tax=Blattamonas nauphoetae TaxID=2049346 RepID=A0ABQ9YDY7_9EUKA|nr:hypothetical protein BLNAU_2954 [Blattamonas nauphoetae]